MFVDLWNEIGAVRRLISADCETQALVFQALVVAVRIIDIACWSFHLLVKVYLFTVAYRGFSARELAGVGIKSNRALRVIIFKSFGFREAEGNLRRRVIRKVPLNILVWHY
jgi:hypothetical protein